MRHKKDIYFTDAELDELDRDNPYNQWMEPKARTQDKHRPTAAELDEKIKVKQELRHLAGLDAYEWLYDEAPTPPAVNQPPGKTIDLTPTWSAILPVLIHGAAHGNLDAIAELGRLARFADALNSRVTSA